jgi:NDP-sugar pyrophosphorylase family protein
MKTRISLTLNKTVLNKVDALVDSTTLRSRSHAIELLISKALKIKKVEQALILAGGKGTRLRPLTYEIPKVMIPLQGKPFLQHLIEMLKSHGITDIIISIGYLGDQVKEYFGNGSKFGVRIRYVEEKEPLGTAGPLRLAKDMLKSTFVMMNGDEYKEVDLQDMFAFHEKEGGVGTVGLTTTDKPQHYGVAVMKGSRIVMFVEKPEDPVSNLINAGVYILEPEVIDKVPEGFAMVETDVFPALAAQGKLAGYPFEGRWYDLGTFERYEKAIKELGNAQD